MRESAKTSLRDRTRDLLNGRQGLLGQAIHAQAQGERALSIDSPAPGSILIRGELRARLRREWPAALPPGHGALPVSAQPGRRKKSKDPAEAGPVQL